MATVQPEPPAKRRGLPRPFVGLCVGIGVFIAAYSVLMLLSIASSSTEHRTRTFPAADALRVDAGSGDVTIVGERRRDVRVEMLIQRGMWRGAWQPTVQAQPGGGSLRLGSECSLWAHAGVSECGASFTIRVPSGTRVVIDVDSGDATVRNIAADVTVTASSGDVEAERVSGVLSLEADSGDVEADDYRGRSVDAHADSGDVDVRVTGPARRVRASADSGDVDVVVPNLSWRVAVDTDSGDQNVHVRQDPDARRTIDARADSGDVTVVRLGED